MAYPKADSSVRTQPLPAPASWAASGKTFLACVLPAVFSGSINDTSVLLFKILELCFACLSHTSVSVNHVCVPTFKICPEHNRLWLLLLLLPRGPGPRHGPPCFYWPCPRTPTQSPLSAESGGLPWRISGKSLPASAGDAGSIPGREDPTCGTVAQPMHHDYCTCVLEPGAATSAARMLRAPAHNKRMQPACPRAPAHNKRSRAVRRPCT